MAVSNDYLDPRWQKKRLEILERDNFTCTECGDNESTLHVHHSHYKKGAKVWDYNNVSLFTLCENCHKKKHEEVKAVDPMKVRRLMDLYMTFSKVSLEFTTYSKGRTIRKFYMQCIMQILNRDERKIMSPFVDDEIECGDNLNNFKILEALMYYKINPRNVQQYVNGCLMMTGEIMKPSDIGKELLDVSRHLKRSIF